MGLKVITASGNIGTDAEMRDAGGKSVCSFSLAVSERKDDPTTWFRCTLWEKKAEALHKYLTKGTKVTVIGSLSLREYTDKAGEKRASLEIRVNDLDFGGGGEKREGGYQRSEPRQASRGTDWSNAGPDNFSDDSIPF